MCLAQSHNRVMPVRLEPAIPRSRVKHSTTEPLHYLTLFVKVEKSSDKRIQFFFKI